MSRPNFYPLEIAGRGSETQLLTGENLARKGLIIRNNKVLTFPGELYLYIPRKLYKTTQQGQG